MLIIPAIDLRGGKCVRLMRGDYAQETVYDADPVSVAQRFESEGAELLHVVDLDGAKSGQIQNASVIQMIIASVSIPVEVGGGIRSVESAITVLQMGAIRTVFGTSIAQSPESVREIFAVLGERAVAGIDARKGRVTVSGWTQDTPEEATDFAQRMERLGAHRVIFTDVDHDGVMDGPNLVAMRRMVDAVKIPVIASGGVGKIDDLLALTETGVEGAIVGKALYEGRFSVAEATQALSVA